MIGRRPYAAFGNSTGDRQMLEYTAAGAGARLTMLVLHDDAAREYAYGPAQGLPDTKVGTFTQALYDEAKKNGWTVISMKNDWKRIFRVRVATVERTICNDDDAGLGQKRWWKGDGGGAAVHLLVPFVLLAFDVVLSPATYVPIAQGANVDDLRALHGMARIRHGYTQIAPIVEPYFTTATHDDVDSVITAYGTLPSSNAGTVLYRLATLGRHDRPHHIDGRRGVHGTVGLLVGAPDELTLWIGIGGGALVFLALVLFAEQPLVTRNSNNFSALFQAAAKAEERATDR